MRRQDFVMTAKKVIRRVYSGAGCKKHWFYCSGDCCQIPFVGDFVAQSERPGI